MRYAFGNKIAELVDKDKRIYVLVADIGYGVFDKLHSENPSHFINVGICEQAMISIASGMAQEGLLPLCYTITPFLLERPFEQIKLDIVQQNQNVKLVGYGSYDAIGPSHTALNVKATCDILGIACVEPKDSKETEEVIEKIMKEDKPYFVSLKKDATL